MPRICTICTHPDRDAVDKAVVSQAPNRQIASLYGVSEAAIRRHKRSHLPKTLVKATEVEAVANAEVVIREWIETAQELGRPIPQPRGRLL